MKIEKKRGLAALAVGVAAFALVIGVISSQFQAEPAYSDATLDKEMQRKLEDDSENIVYEPETEEATEIAPEESTEELQEPETQDVYDLTDRIPIPDVEFPYYIKVNRQANCVTVYTLDENGNYTVPVKAMVCSVGLDDETPLGVFQTSDKYTWHALYGDVYGQYAYRIHNAIMFHSVPYYTTNKNDLESEEYNKLGEPASLGCVRLAVIDAKWLVENCPAGTTVEIYDSSDPGPLGRPEPIRIDLDSPNAGWDPTDPDPSNPWNADGSAEEIPVNTETESGDKTESEPSGEPEPDTDTETIEPEENEKTGNEADTTAPPKLYGTDVRIIEKGTSVDLLEGVTAYDAQGNALKVTVSGDLDASKVGSYTNIYSATDQYGNTTTERVACYVVDTTPPTVSVPDTIVITDNERNHLADYLMSKIKAADGSQELDDSHISVNYSGAAYAVSTYRYGSYSCSAYAVDDAGNRSETVSFKVVYSQN